MPGPGRVIRGALTLVEPLPGSVLTLGTFDGVHRGHQLLLARAAAVARARSLPCVAYTFDPNPAKVLVPARAPGALVSLAERLRLLFAAGAELVVVEPFDPAFARVSADEWVARYLVRPLAPVHVVVGFNFGYGRDRAGGPAHLVSAGAAFGFSVDVVGSEAAADAGGAISSTRVREAVLAGQVDGARALLGRPFALTGPVVRGDERGRTLGFPTANLAPEADVLPAAGVYATRVWLEDAATPLPAVSNVGVRPTFAGAETRVETHLIDFEGDLYGRRLRVEFVARLRGEQRFTDVEALRRQITLDVAAARARLGEG